jgi:RecB family exonuclease
VITPRRTRLVRVPDLHAFRHAIGVIWERSDARADESRLIVVPTKAAGRLVHLPSTALRPGKADTTYDCVTRDQLYDRLHARLPRAPRRLNRFEREAMAQAAAVEASGDGQSTRALPFQLRPGLIAEILRFYDQLRRQSQQLHRFEELIEEAVGAAADKGAERLLQQTRFLARTFRSYERRLAQAGTCDEHTLREQLLAEPATPPLRHVIVTVSDWIADPDGLFVADFDLLSRMPGLEAVDIVSTEGVLGSGFHGRLHNWWPELEEQQASDLIGAPTATPPVLLTPPAARPEQPWFAARDREEELVAIARRIKADADPILERHAVVYKRPLPYLYLAAEAFTSAGIPHQTGDGLPLAAEPVAAAIDLILEFVEAGFTRDTVVALLRSPHFCFGVDRAALGRAVVALDRGLSHARYLGGLPSLESLAARTASEALPALEIALSAARELAALAQPAPASLQIRRLLAFFQDHAQSLEADDPYVSREQRARTAVVEILEALARAREAHDDSAWTIVELASSVRQWIGEETFTRVTTSAGLHLVDDQTARFGEFDDMTLVGLVEAEWPERPRRNIFYPSHLLKLLGWPTEKDRSAAADARFLDLLASPTRRIAVSTPMLDGDTLMMRSAQLDEIPRARLVAAPERASATAPANAPEDDIREWAAMRRERPPAASAEFHGTVGSHPGRTWTVSALETYLGCPFKFYAQHVLRLEEEPDDEEVMDPRRQGQLVHEVFEKFFAEWQSSGRRAVTRENLDEARAMFTAVVDRVLAQLPDAEAGLERTRLLGSSAAAGLGEAVLRMEAERPTGVVERLLEHRIDGQITIETAAGPRQVAIRGKTDRLDLLEDGTFRLIDYKLGWPPDRSRALQLPIYGICAEQQLSKVRPKVQLSPDTPYEDWKLGEAVYLAFKGPRRVVPLFTSDSQRDEVLAKAQQRLADTLDAIERGDFPPTPDDVYRCETCSFASVCRKDYVGDV